MSLINIFKLFQIIKKSVSKRIYRESNFKLFFKFILPFIFITFGFMKNTHYKKLENIYLNAKLNKEIYSGIEIVISKNYSEIKMPIKQDYFHALKAIHGSVYFKMLDDAAFFAAQSVVKDYMLLTASFNITFKMPVSNGYIKSIGTLFSVSERELKAESKMYDSNNELVAFGNGIFKKSKISISSIKSD